MVQHNRGLEAVLAQLQPVLCEEVYVFVSCPAELTQCEAFAMVREDGRFSYVVSAADAERIGLDGEFRCRRLELGLDTELALVGLLARITAELARHGIPVNPIAGARRDHLFVPIARANDALEVLEGVVARARVLDVWFGELDDGFASKAHRERWFAGDADFDRSIRDEFATLLEQAARGELTDWQNEPHDCLAYIVLTDQFSRQIHRGTARAFATDPQALAAARAGLARGFDAALEWDERTFFYLPFEHSERLEDQDTAVRLFQRLRDAAPQRHREVLDRNATFAEAHRDIIRRFGRFPHRNDALGRESTAAERDYLVSARRFGQ